MLRIGDRVMRIGSADASHTNRTVSKASCRASVFRVMFNRHEGGYSA